MLVAVYGKCYSDPGRNGIQTVAIADIVGLYYGLEVVVQAHGAEGCQCFVLWLMHLCWIVVLSCAWLHVAAAGNRTLPAAVFALLQIDYFLVADGSGSGKIQRCTFPVPDRGISCLD